MTRCSSPALPSRWKQICFPMRFGPSNLSRWVSGHCPSNLSCRSSGDCPSNLSQILGYCSNSRSNRSRCCCRRCRSLPHTCCHLQPLTWRVIAMKGIFALGFATVEGGGSASAIGNHHHRYRQSVPQPSNSVFGKSDERRRDDAAIKSWAQT
jgi:hypothetical protein